MDHLQFKERATAAKYVRNELDERTQEAFELHLMACAECVEDVEIWRVVKEHAPEFRIPKNTSRARRGGARLHSWQIAACFAVGTGAAIGWFGKDATVPNLNSTETVVFSMPNVMRGTGECTTLRLALNTRLVVGSVPAIPAEHQLVALDANWHELPAGSYKSRRQPDGSHLLSIDPRVLVAGEIHLEARRADGASAPLGCLVSETLARGTQ
jgi:hypothetical protein